jgi:CRISPR-associated endonuclease/helicase Cas3
MTYIAHRRKNARDEWEDQALSAHLEGTAKLCREFASAFGFGEVGYVLGKVHDIGKYSRGFQDRILGGGKSVDHSTAGGQVVNELIGKIFAYPIFGHHGGLPNGGSPYDDAEEGTLYARFKKKLNGDSDFSAYKSEINPECPAVLPPIPLPVNGNFSVSFLVRMLFSCLVDADFLDTEEFMSGRAIKRGGYAGIDELFCGLKQYMKEKFETPREARKINEKRDEILQNCLERALCAQGLYSLTVPTGGGKTLASLMFALLHAKTHGLKRVIYVVPYVNIIEQTCEVFEKALGSQNVLEHHCNVNYDNDDPEQFRKYLSTENWDAPIIVTTAVQFFESLFAARPSNCRKLHNIAESVIVFDEAQMLPIPYLKPCVSAIAELVCNYRCTAALCTATQPALDGIFPSSSDPQGAPQLKRVEICDAPEELHTFFQRVSIKMLGSQDDEALVNRLKSHEQALCIVSTKRQAQNLYGMMGGDRACFHLSTLMTPVQRKWILRRVRRRLLDNKPCRLIATSLVEAGVDVDFPTVYRAAAGLASIIQAAGRCNREWRRSRNESKVYVFTPESSYRIPDSQKRPIEVFRGIAAKYDDIASLSAIREYFEMLYRLEGDREHDTGLDKKEILCRLSGGVFPFRDIERDFRLIEEKTRVVLIPKGRGKRIEEALRRGERSRPLMRALGRYSVHVYEKHLEKLSASGSVESLDGEIYVLRDPTQFNFNTGLSLNPQGGQALFFDA